MRKLSFLFAVLLFPLAAWADSPGEVTSVSPTTFTFGVLEQFLTIHGTGLSEADPEVGSTIVKFNGAGLSMDVEATFRTPTKVVVAVPDQVLTRLGHCNVHVFVTYADGSTRNVGLGSFDVVLAPPPPPAPPIILGPDVITEEATGPDGAVVTWVVVVQSQVDENLEAQCTPSSGSFFPLGVSNVHCTATDANGSASLDIEVIVTDTTPPVLTLPEDITTTNGVVTFTATATDIVDGAITPVCEPASGSTFDTGTTTVTCTATDSSLNETTGTFNVTVIADTTPPEVVRISASPGILSPPNHEMVAVTVTVVATDDIDPNPVSQIVSVTSNQAIDGTGDGDQSPDWEITGPLTLNLRAERASGEDRVYTITVVTTDAAGNATMSTVTVVANNSNASMNSARW
ncbi:MAG TPA: HYR domain-containing protein [Thermoanaerobaculia bacterium]|nr:HYR domain-containing protein [Thermoanaerobaculia bacterium]